MNTQVDILLKMRADLAGARQTTDAMKDLLKLASGFGASIKQGFGINIAGNITNFIKETIAEAFRAPFEMASELRGIQENLNIDTTPYQVLKEVVEDSGQEVGVLNKALIEQNKSLFEAGQSGGKAYDAYRKLGLSVATLKTLTPEQQFEAIAKAIAGADDKQAAFAAAAEILGSKNLPKLKAALAEVAEKGYRQIAKEAEAAGKILSPEATARLNAAAQAWRDFKQSLAVKTGEDAASLLGFLGQEVDIPKPPPAPTAEEIAQAKQREKDILAEADATRILTNAQLGFANLTADANKTDAEKRRQLSDSLRLQAEQIDRLNQARFRELEPLKDSKDLTAEQIKQLEESNRLMAQAEALRLRARAIDTGGTSAFARSRERFQNVNDPASKNFMTADEGLQAGAMNFVSNLGSTGEQVAQTLETTLGQTVSGISDGIYGWVTGTQSFGDALLNLGDTIFRTFINSIVQMGVNWVITQGLILAGMRTIEATGDAFRAARIVKENAAEAATLPAKTAGAAAAGVSSYGVALAFGIAAIALIAALSGGFAEGGFVSGPGTGTSDSILARLSNGEFVMPAAAVQRIGLPALEAMRFNRPSPTFATGGPVGSSSATSGAGFGGGGRPVVVNNLFDKAQLRAAMFDDEGEAHLVDIMQRNRWRFEG